LTPRSWEQSSLSYGGRLRSNRELAAKYARDIRPGGARGYDWQLLASAGWTSIHWLHQLREPTPILSRRDDPIVPWVNAQIMACLIPDSTLHLFDDAQLGLLTSAEELAPIVREFLTKEVGNPS
jgi:poly(3-hydroxyoctanoate) depolymerase